MNYAGLLELAMELGYRLAMSGAETYRVEESINRVIGTYGVQSEVFAIPNCLTVSMETPDGQPVTRMRRIGSHGNDLNAVEQYSNLSRRICMEKPTLEQAWQWLEKTKAGLRFYPFPGKLLGNFLGACGFCMLFGGSWVDALCAGICGILIGLVDKLTAHHMGANAFFRTAASAFFMAVAAYALGVGKIAGNPDAVIIGASMILVPGLLFTNAMRDILYGDTNSGINRIVQVLLTAVAIAMGTAAAWNLASALWGVGTSGAGITYNYLIQAIACGVGCLGFAIQFNIHGPGGLLCMLGGVVTWLIYLITLEYSGNDLLAYFFATLFSTAYAEVMARVRKYPAISYLVVSVFPLLPGAGIYFAMSSAVTGQMAQFARQGMHTAAIAGIMALAILLVSTVVTGFFTWRRKRAARRSTKK